MTQATINCQKHPKLFEALNIMRHDIGLPHYEEEDFHLPEECWSTQDDVELAEKQIASISTERLELLAIGEQEERDKFISAFALQDANRVLEELFESLC